MSFCCVRYNNPAVHFSTQPYLLLFLVFSGNLKLHLFQLFHFFMKPRHVHYNWQQNRIEKIGDTFQSVPTL